MKVQRLATLATAIGATFLTACGGGGGGASATLAPFTSFSAAQPNSTITAGGISQSGTYVYDVVNDVITARTIAASTTGASISVTTNSNGLATALTVTPAGGAPIAFSSPTDTFGVLNINSDIGAVVSADGTKYALLADPITIGWDYQTFGVWVTGAGTGSGTYGALSVGAETAGGAIPTSGTALYIGYTGGRATNAAGNYVFTSSAMTAARV